MHIRDSERVYDTEIWFTCRHLGCVYVCACLCFSFASVVFFKNASVFLHQCFLETRLNGLSLIICAVFSTSVASPSLPPWLETIVSFPAYSGFLPNPCNLRPADKLKFVLGCVLLLTEILV
jgi:hypothetical protein